FPTTNYSEDIHWAWQMFNKGFCLGYEPKASVWHYHHETFHYRYKRHLIEITNHYSLYKLITWPKFGKANLIPFYQTYKKAKSHFIKWFLYNIRLLFANKLAETTLILTYFLSGEKGIQKKYFKITKEIPIGKNK
ncbi:MAG: hypothetical protein JXB49_31880, partial [Bacteroidales bacterium]|nr:hypothetical protein [Bacteroidales bacterium]